MLGNSKVQWPILKFPPYLRLYMLSWIIRRSGNTEMVEDKMNTIDKTIDAIAQNIMYATKPCK